MALTNAQWILPPGGKSGFNQALLRGPGGSGARASKSQKPRPAALDVDLLFVLFLFIQEEFFVFCCVSEAGCSRVA